MVITGAVDDDIGEPITAAGVARSFSGYAHRTANAGDNIDITRPLWEYEDETKPSCRLRWAKKIDGPVLQMVTLFFVAVDVIAVILEVLLEFTQGLCPGHGKLECCNCAELAGCHNISYSATLPADDHRAPLPFETCDDHHWKGCCHDGGKPGELAETITAFLHYTSVGILFSFLAQMLLLMCLYCGLFFKNVFYVVDLVIIVVSLVIELTVHEVQHRISKSAAGVSQIFTALLTTVLFWRVIRIVHGLVAAAEKSHHLQMERTLEVLKKFHNRVHNTKMLLSAARHGASHFEESTHKEQGLSETDKKMLQACKEGSPPGMEELEALLRRRQEHRRKHEEFLEEMSNSLERMHSQMSVHEKMLKDEVHHAEHHNHASSLKDHGHGHGHDDHGHGKHKTGTKKIHPVDDDKHLH